MTELDIKNIGLRGITVADTRISLVDGLRGQLLYRGYHIRDLAAKATYEEVVHLLLLDRLPTAREQALVRAKLAAGRRLPDEVWTYLTLRHADARPMDVIQGAVPLLADHDPDLDAAGRPAMVRSSLRLIGRLGTIVAAWLYQRRGEPLADTFADPAVSHARALMQMFLGREASEDEERLMDILLILHAEHTFNASTFSARQVASTLAHMYAAVTAGVGSLSGRLHGGANARVMEMLLEIGDLDQVPAWLEQRIASKRRIMGLGHAVYRTEDPRAAILRTVAERTLAGREQEKWLRLACEVERIARQTLREKRGLDLWPNVDFYSGPILYALGLPTDMFPAFFALSRVAGWCAHVIEEQLAEAAPKPTLYRPGSTYIGRYCGEEGCPLEPLPQRGADCLYDDDYEGCQEIDKPAP
jgi:citrate synthase